MDNIISYITCFSWLPHLLMGLLGLLLGWLLFRGKVQAGDLSIEGEGQLRADADGLRTRISDLEGRVGRRDTTISGLEGKLTAAPTASADGDDDETYALEWRNRYLAARVKYLEGRISDAPKPKKKAVKKKAAPKKRVAKKAAPKKKVVKKKAAPKKNMSIIARGQSQDAVDAYYANARKYDKSVTRKRIAELTKYCGISLNTRDASLVACSQEHERATIVKGYCAKKLGMNADEAGKAVAAVCTKMKGERFKSRVTFYHLLSKGAGKKKAAPKKAVAKKAAPKKIVAKKAPAKKKAPANPNDKYYALVRKQDAKASKSVIDNIVKYCGIALRTRDGSLVACTDEKERDTIAKGFAVKKLGMKTGQAELVADTCQAMKATRMKNRVAFYYVMAKKAGKLSVFK